VNLLEYSYSVEFIIAAQVSIMIFPNGRGDSQGVSSITLSNLTQCM